MIKRFWKFLSGDWWKPVTNGQIWGIYHPWKWHCWGYAMTEEEAKKKCKELNYK